MTLPCQSADVVVIGAGPAGLSAAIAAARSGRSTLLLEALASPGTRLLATGGGRCNLTNTLSQGEMADSFGRRSRFVRHAISAFPPDAVRAFIEKIGVETRAVDGFHVFPASDSAQDVLLALRREAAAASVVAVNGNPAIAVLMTENAATGVETSEGPIACSSVVVATGGACRPGLGATGDGYSFAISAGHAVVPPKPALAQIEVKESWVGECAGVTVKDAVLRFVGAGRDRSSRRGTILFTHNGLSGPAALDISGDASEEIADGRVARITADFTPESGQDEWEATMIAWQAHRGKAMVKNLLDSQLPSSLAMTVVKECCRDPNVRASALNKVERRAIAAMIKGCRLTVTGTGDLNSAIVTRGGVDVAEVDPSTMQSRLVRGLYFAGEVLDVDGPCGGYNLQWAFSSGRLAGISAAKSRA